MIFRSDLHLHSPYSRATSPACTPAGIAQAARIKGIQVIATGDCIHPVWLSLLDEHLEPAEPGLFSLKKPYAKESMQYLPSVGTQSPVRFMLSTEISLIYKHDGATRKVHHLIYLPTIASARRLQSVLASRGNIHSDGRPILGMSSHELLSLVLEVSSEAVLIPAHGWTPWFSLFGSRSGYDRLEDCFGDLSDQIFAIETGLSADPDMIRRISALDHLALLSNSDCHSLAMVAREATVYDTELSYNGIMQTLRANDRQTLLGTIEFFPEEGKYHHDGHRDCGVCLSPQESLSLHNRCPVCSKPLTLGVLHRINSMADRELPVYPINAPDQQHTVPLREILSRLLSVGVSSKKVSNYYEQTLRCLGSELDILLTLPICAIGDFDQKLARHIEAIRSNNVLREAGFDGQFGRITIS